MNINSKLLIGNTTEPTDGKYSYMSANIANFKRQPAYKDGIR
jgi:hypothetical protein